MKTVRWPLWAFPSKKFQVNLTAHKLEEFPPPQFISDIFNLLLVVEWKGPASTFGTRFRRKMKTQQTCEAIISQGSIALEKEFKNLCVLALSKDAVFQPWHVLLLIRKVTTKQPKCRWSVLGKAVLDLSKFAPPSGNANQIVKIPVNCDADNGNQTILSVTLNFVELLGQGNGSEGFHWIAVPSFCLGAKLDKDDADEVLMMNRLQQKGANGYSHDEYSKKISMEDTPLEEKLFPALNDESYYASGDTFESDSVEEQNNNDEYLEDLNIRKVLGYGTIAGTNLAFGKTFSYDSGVEGESEFSDILSLCKSPLDLPKLVEETSSSDSDQNPNQSSMKSLLSWRKRKLTFRSPQARGEPLLHKAYGEVGGDEIDWDRRQCCTPSQPLEVLECGAIIDHNPCDFGESFRVGNWEQKEITSRDRKLKLCTEVFFASIDQCSESVAGESACTALVAVIADWLHRQPNAIPSKTEFNTLIRDGSAEWRKLCDQESYKDSFPDRHFDLETVIQAAVRPLSVLSEKSFVGFFQTEGLSESGELLQGLMSFDSIWSEIEYAGTAVYAVSWNDHFFILKMEDSGCYIIDTLGERLYEGCNQAYILKFDSGTNLCHLSSNLDEHVKVAEQQESLHLPGSTSVDEIHGPDNNPQLGHSVATDGMQMEATRGHFRKDGGGSSAPQRQAVYTGKDACREFVKGFFAALPLRELQDEVKKGVHERNYIFRRLQIDFHFTSLRCDFLLSN